MLVFENFLSVYTKEYCQYNMYVIKIVLIFIYIFLKIFFFSTLFMGSTCILCAQNCFVPVTVRFPGYAFNENICMYSQCCSHKQDVFLIYIFLQQTQKLKNKSVLSTILGKICDVACTINHGGKLHACLHEFDHASIIDKPDI